MQIIPLTGPLRVPQAGYFYAFSTGPRSASLPTRLGHIGAYGAAQRHMAGRDSSARDAEEPDFQLQNGRGSGQKPLSLFSWPAFPAANFQILYKANPSCIFCKTVLPFCETVLHTAALPEWKTVLHAAERMNPGIYQVIQR